jgi:hypothetical protein
LLTVLNILKVKLLYNLAVNQLISYAVSIKGQAAFLAENVGNQEKL